MALSKFLFTTAQNNDILLSALNASETASSKVGKDLWSATKSLTKNVGSTFSGGTGNFFAGVGSAIAVPVTAVGSGVTGGFGYILKQLSNLADKSLYQEMYLNPDQIKITYRIPNSKKEMFGGVSVQHYRPELPEITMSGIVGWIREESRLDSALNNAAKAFVSGENIGDALKQPFKDIEFRAKSLADIKKFREKLRNVSNSPRKFMENLQRMALSPQYYIPLFGDRLEAYNVKKIIIFTKQYPNGKALEGYFTSFNVEENGNDPETLRYNFTFIVYNMTNIGLSERIGQFIAPFAGAGIDVSNKTGNLVSSVVNPVTNLFR
jgi:hypothetical protein